MYLYSILEFKNLFRRIYRITRIILSFRKESKMKSSYGTKALVSAESGLRLPGFSGT